MFQSFKQVDNEKDRLLFFLYLDWFVVLKNSTAVYGTGAFLMAAFEVYQFVK